MGIPMRLRKQPELAFKPSIARPCEESWAAMSGGHRQRHCQLCGKHVHNFAALTVPEIERLVLKSNGSLCARITQRGDGSIVTLEARQPKARGLVRAAQVAALASIALSALRGGAQSPSSPTPKPATLSPQKTGARAAVETENQMSAPSPAAEKAKAPHLDERTFIGQVDVTTDDSIPATVVEPQTALIETDLPKALSEIPLPIFKAHYTLASILRHPIVFIRSRSRKQ